MGCSGVRRCELWWVIRGNFWRGRLPRCAGVNVGPLSYGFNDQLISTMPTRHSCDIISRPRAVFAEDQEFCVCVLDNRHQQVVGEKKNVSNLPGRRDSDIQWLQLVVLQSLTIPIFPEHSESLGSFISVTIVCFERLPLLLRIFSQHDRLGLDYNRTQPSGSWG